MKAAWLFALVLVAGCVDSTPSDEEAALTDGSHDVTGSQAGEETFTWNITHEGVQLMWGNATEIVIKSGAVEYHNGDAYSQVTQPIAHPCAYGGGTYFNTQPLTAAKIPFGTRDVSILLDWDETSYLRENMRVAYWTPATFAYTESAPFPKNTDHHLPVDPYDWTRHDGVDSPGSWNLVACTDADTAGDEVPPHLFVGELRYTFKAYRMTPEEVDAAIAKYMD